MIDISFIGFSELTDKLAALPGQVRDALETKMESLSEALKVKVQDDELSGQALESRTGTLKGSIENAMAADGSELTASVFVGGDVPYAAILEYGGVTKAHVIEATNGSGLAFLFQGKQSFFRIVHHPGSNIAPHPYLEPALEGMQDDIISGLEDALEDAIS